MRSTETTTAVDVDTPDCMRRRGTFTYRPVALVLACGLVALASTPAEAATGGRPPPCRRLRGTTAFDSAERPTHRRW
jgi:hypothetical protein